MVGSDKSELELEVGRLVKNLYKYFKVVSVVSKKNQKLTNVLIGIKKELLEIKEELNEYKKRQNGKNKD